MIRKGPELQAPGLLKTNGYIGARNENSFSGFGIQRQALVFRRTMLKNCPAGPGRRASIEGILPGTEAAKRQTVP
jgi:hypothetical protein